MIFLDRYALPVWLDPTPLVLHRLDRYKRLPVREPFSIDRRELKTDLPFDLARISANQARHKKVLDELRETGETHYERRLRKMREWHANNDRKKAA